MAHIALDWPDDNADNSRLWVVAVTHAALLYTDMPHTNLGWMTPLEIFTKIQRSHCDLLRIKVWRCPVVILHPKFQDV